LCGQVFCLQADRAVLARDFGTFGAASSGQNGVSQYYGTFSQTYGGVRDIPWGFTGIVASFPDIMEALPNLGKTFPKLRKPAHKTGKQFHRERRHSPMSRRHCPILGNHNRMTRNTLPRSWKPFLQSGNHGSMTRGCRITLGNDPNLEPGGGGCSIFEQCVQFLNSMYQNGTQAGGTWREESGISRNRTQRKSLLPSDGRLEPFGKRRKEFGGAESPQRAKRAGASESTRPKAG